MDGALILIDVQHAIDDPSWGRRNQPDAEANIARLLADWRARGSPVLHVHHVSKDPASSFQGRGVAPKPLAEPREGEPVIVKHTPNAFAGTELETILRDRGIGALVVTGFITNNSVETTVRVAATLGFRVHVVGDACATFDRVDLDGRHWAAEDVHALSLANLSGEYAEVITTDEALS
jgi:nicotinamidase-related amidase